MLFPGEYAEFRIVLVNVYSMPGNAQGSGVIKVARIYSARSLRGLTNKLIVLPASAASSVSLTMLLLQSRAAGL